MTLIASCSSSATTSASPSAQSSVAPSETGTSGQPPGCDPVDLRDPSGERVVLDGRWTEVGTPDRVELMTWWLYTQGDCVWGAGQIDEVLIDTTSATPDDVQGLTGSIQSDFTITGEIVLLGPLPPFAPGSPVRYSPLRMLIEFGGAGEVLLREDREAGVRGPRCPDPQAYCPDPLVLQRAD